MSFFSNSRLDVLSSRLGNDELKSLMSQISNMIKTRTEVHHHSLGPSNIWGPSASAPTLSADRARHFIDVYFKYVHPLYPFLDRHEFESRAFSTKLDSDLANGASWAALYYAVLALGCEADGGGSFAPGKGEAWSLFRVALDLYPRVLLLNTELLEVQVGQISILLLKSIISELTAVFCLNLSGSQIQGKITSEAARVAQRAFLNKSSTSSDAAIRSRAFWVVYYIEKTISFQHGTTSFIVDCDIGVPVPFIEESFFDGLDWFLMSIRFARLYSRIFTELFSISATKNSKESYLTKITEFGKLLDKQRQAIPSLFRPGLKLRPHAFSSPCGIVAALRIHYHFHELKIALHRLKLHVTRDQRYSQQWPTLTEMMGSARAVIDLTRLIQQEPSTSFYIIIYLPLTALFVLFDRVIHDPNSEDARINLVLLESVTGFFSALEYVTDGYLPGSMLVQFASIAREFYKTRRMGSSSNGESIDSGHVSTETPDTGTSGRAHLPWEANNDIRSQDTSSFSLSGFIYPDGMDTVGLEVMDLFGGPMAGFELYQA
ncbi:hypothetical protein AARAC_007329 [Aspergillus arachidicola]|uniref:Xylanolytic transcriptional activator regulatory domain-containing protein n=1 Tax=Aspergillus arachidicola TaxID=656916 RepID=A0A2G7FYA2_9EURO|nr:hypothetical protein AARAC_007329 [Aspergillus arachidicola]